MNTYTLKTKKPAIYIDFVEEVPGCIKYVEYGIEEEGVPWEKRKSSCRDAVSAAYKAASDSPIGIGIGIGENNQLVLHHQKLPERQPLFNLRGVSKEEARTLGANSARLAKRIPLKLKKTPEGNDCNTNPDAEKNCIDLSERELIDLITIVVKEVLKRHPQFRGWGD
jgi:hypothetical protein